MKDPDSASDKTIFKVTAVLKIATYMSAFCFPSPHAHRPLVEAQFGKKVITPSMKHEWFFFIFSDQIAHKIKHPTSIAASIR